MGDLDTRLFLALHAYFSRGAWLYVMATVTALGSGWGSLLVLPLFVSPKTRRFGGYFAAALAVTGTLVFVLKALIGRRRPYLALQVPALVFEAPTDFSCPSGHAGGTFAFVTFLAVVLVRSRVAGRARWRFALVGALYVLAVLIGLSRIALGVHYPGDVAFGAALGGALGGLAASLYLRGIPAT